MIGVLGALLGAILGPGLPAHASGVPDEVLDGTPAWLQPGLELQLAEDYDGALRWVERMRDERPDDPELSLFETATLYWRFLYDESDPHLDDDINASAERTLALCRERLERDDDDAQAHFWCGQAYADRVRLYGVRKRYLRGALLAERGQDHLERALALDPELIDAKYMLGLGLYYVAALPRVVQRLSWLWFVPEGDRDRGVAYLREVARTRGRFEIAALFSLSVIHTMEEGLASPQGLAVAEELHRRLPDHSLFHFRLIHLLYSQGRYGRVVEEAEELETRPALSREARGRRLLARIWRARAELRFGKLERARDTLASFDDAAAETLPRWGPSWLLLTRAEAHEARGQHAEARDLYRRITELDPDRRSARANLLAETALARAAYEERHTAAPPVAGGAQD